MKKTIRRLRRLRSGPAQIESSGEGASLECAGPGGALVQPHQRGLMKFTGFDGAGEAAPGRRTPGRRPSPEKLTHPRGLQLEGLADCWRSGGLRYASTTDYYLPVPQAEPNLGRWPRLLHSVSLALWRPASAPCLVNRFSLSPLSLPLCPLQRTANQLSRLVPRL